MWSLLICFVGFNKYYPPDYDPDKHASLNAYRGARLVLLRFVVGVLMTLLQASMPSGTGLGNLTRVSSSHALSFRTISGGTCTVICLIQRLTLTFP